MLDVYNTFKYKFRIIISVFIKHGYYIIQRNNIKWHYIHNFCMVEEGIISGKLLTYIYKKKAFKSNFNSPPPLRMVITHYILLVY